MFMRGGNRDVSFSKGWQQCPLFYKFLVLTCLPLGLIGIFTNVFLQSFVMIPSQVFSFQLWRLFTSWMVDMSILNSIFAVLMLYYYYVPREQKFGTVYSMLDFFVMTVIIQVTICLLQFIGSFMFEKINLFGLGLWSMVFIYLSRVSYEDPDAERPFCCLPCNIPSKYFPIGMILIFSLIGGVRAGDVVAFLIGLLEYLVFKKVLIRYPLSWVMKLEGCMPGFLSRRADFVTSSKCYGNLQAVCRGNPMEGREPQNVVVGNGVVIGHSEGNQVRNQNELRQFWANKDQQSPQQLRQHMNDTVMSDESSRNFR